MAPPYRTVCYALAIMHTIGASTALLGAFVGMGLMVKMAMDPLPPEQATPEDQHSLYTIFGVVFIIAGIVAVLQIFVGAWCIIGIKKQLPHYVRRFRINAIVFLVLLGLSVLASFATQSPPLASLPSIAFYGAEVWAAGKYYDIMVEEIRQNGYNAVPNQAFLA